jgi:Leucine-rich repeat (LRR) protein
MKKNDWILTISVILYSLLFYKQSLGINFLLFNVFVIGSLLIREKALLKNKYWVITAIATLTSAICIFVYGNLLSFFANFFSLCMLSVYSINKNSSVFLALFYSICSQASSMVFIIIDSVERRKKRAVTKKTGVFTKILLGIIVFIVLLVFFLLYQKSNPLFYNFTKDINLDFITASWIFFTIGGLLLLYGFYYPLRFEGIYQKDMANSNDLPEKTEEEYSKSKWRKLFSFHVELSVGNILFILLNIMLIVLNILDVSYLWINKTIPEGLTYSDYVHQGTGTLILSIIFAIMVILFFFRSQINYYKNNKAIKILVYFWIMQNLMMVISTAYRNLLYINEYSLTYKRIGVYVYLLLAFIGLVTTLLKIAYTKSNWYLFRKNTWAVFFVLVIASFVNWDVLITKFNIEKSKQVDVNYLVSLSYKNLPVLLSHKFNEEELTIKGKEDFDYRNYPYNNYVFSSYSYYNNLHRKMFEFLARYDTADWQSYCLNKSMVVKEILDLEKAGKIDSLVLHTCNIKTLAPIKDFSNLKELNLDNDMVRDMNEFRYFTKLKTLYLANNQIDSLDNFPPLSELKYLDIRNNHISNAEPLTVLNSLEQLNISSNRLKEVGSIAKLKNIKTLNISGNPINNLGPLAEMKELRSLDLSYSPEVNFKTLPLLPALSELWLNNNQLSSKNYDLLLKLSGFQNLTGLYLGSNELETLNFIPLYLDKTSKSDKPAATVFDKLQVFDVSNCSLKNISSVIYLQNLMELNIYGNQLTDISSIASLNNLAVLNASTNNIEDISSLAELEHLVKVNLANNRIDSIPFLKSGKSLLDLNLSNNQVFSIKALSGLSNVVTLNLNNNNVSDISALTGLKSLERLYLMNNPIKDYSPLYGLKQLKELQLTNISEKQLDQLKKALPNTKIDSGYTNQ